ncbi:DUF6053 domain-containing protein [Lysobacter enzymogenes]|uniref:DUF6053 domain-containing protein n=1 Tax=Lysobacter enzymogenes TaxID=69 RepID=UPI003D18A24C
MGGPSGPMPSVRIAAICAESVGPEGPPTVFARGARRFRARTQPGIPIARNRASAYGRLPAARPATARRRSPCPAQAPHRLRRLIARRLGMGWTNAFFWAAWAGQACCCCSDC